MTDAPSVLERVTTPDAAEMDALIALYEAAIPFEERKGADAIRAMAQSSTHVVGVAKQEGELAGFFLLFRGPSVAMLEYLAVAANVQGSGIGSFLYRSAREAAGTRPLIVEIESPDGHATPAEQSLRRRRLDFYRRNGCRLLLDIDYILPLPMAGHAPLIALLLDNYQGNTIEARIVAGWLEELYALVYACAADDPRLTQILATIPDPVPLG